MPCRVGRVADSVLRPHPEQRARASREPKLQDGPVVVKIVVYEGQNPSCSPCGGKDVFLESAVCCSLDYNRTVEKSKWLRFFPKDDNLGELMS